MDGDFYPRQKCVILDLLEGFASNDPCNHVTCKKHWSKTSQIHLHLISSSKLSKVMNRAVDADVVKLTVASLGRQER